MSNDDRPRGQPPCPCCGEPYDDFVYRSDLEAGDEPPETNCETGLGFYEHDDAGDEN